MNATTRRIMLATVLVWAGFISTARSQELSPEGCLNLVPAAAAESGFRMHATRVKDGNGERRVWAPVREMNVARLIFIGQPALPLPQQEQIAQSLTAQGYHDDKGGMEELTERIRDAWQQHGYFMAKVDLSGRQVLDDGAQAITVAWTVRVDAGRQYRLDEIDLQVTPFHPARQLASAEQQQFFAVQSRALFPIQPGKIFDTHKIQQGLEALRKAYQARGFINMSAVPVPQANEKTGGIKLLLEVEEGRQFRLGSIKVLGLDPPVARRLLDTTGLVSGNVFDGSRLAEFYRDSGVALPDGYSVWDYVRQRIDEETATADLTLRAPCPDR